MKRILILGITNLSNMGDHLIAESTEFLVKRECPNCEVIHGELFLRWKQQKGVVKCTTFIMTVVRLLAERFKNYNLAECAFSLQHARYYKKLLNKADYVIITSGMLKYSTQSHAYMYSVLSRMAEKMKKPLLLNAKSIQRGDPYDKRYKLLINALHREMVTINTRDGYEGTKILENDYNIKGPQSVGDPALWASEVYHLPSPNIINKDVVIGVNLIRPSIYYDYGLDVSPIRIIDLYNNLLEELSKRGYKWRLFCNGMKEDIEWINQLKVRVDDKIIIPLSARDLCQTISRFDLVIGFRLHSCITAVAYNVPLVGMIWDDKSRLFAKSMGLEHFFVEPNQLETKYIVDMVDRRMRYPVDYATKLELKEKCRMAISCFLNNTVNPE